MLCINANKFDPETGKSIRDHGCGSCIACKINEKRKWTSRILLETLATKHAAWVTLTFDEKNVPDQLSKEHVRKYMRLLRKQNPGNNYRYFASGELGDRFGRPHYHLIIWNHQPRFNMDSKTGRVFDPVIEKAWPYGGTMTEDLMLSNSLEKRAAYIAGYVVKKYSKPEHHEEEPIVLKAELKMGPKSKLIDSYLDKKWQPEIQPEFAIMSTKPGIGTTALPKFAEMLTSKYGSMIIANLRTVPGQYRFNNKLWPIPRYLRVKLADMIGIECTPVPKTDLKIAISFDGSSKYEIQIPKQEPDTKEKAYYRYTQCKKRLQNEKLSRMARSAKTHSYTGNAFSKKTAKKA